MNGVLLGHGLVNGMPESAVEYLRSHVDNVLLCGTVSVDGVDDRLVEAVVRHEEEELYALDVLALLYPAYLDVDSHTSRHDDTAVIESAVELGIECLEGCCLVVEALCCGGCCRLLVFLVFLLE